MLDELEELEFPSEVSDTPYSSCQASTWTAGKTFREPVLAQSRPAGEESLYCRSGSSSSLLVTQGFLGRNANAGEPSTISNDNDTICDSWLTQDLSGDIFPPDMMTYSLGWIGWGDMLPEESQDDP